MNVELAIAGLGWFVLAFGHTTIGLRWVLPNLTKGRLPSTPFGPPSMTLGMMRFTWQFVSVLQVGFRHPVHGTGLGSGCRSEDLAAALGCRALAGCYGAGVLAGSPPSAQPPAPTGAVGVPGDRGAVLDSIHMSPDPFAITGLG
jgi:hypothetical protein